MSKYNEETFNDLMKLVERDESFFFKDFNLEDKVYRIFNYNLASWTSFQQPGAMDCRGIMFEVSDIQSPILSSLPPQKFFNYEEGGVNHSVCQMGDKMIKMDGSLISTYLHKGELFLKSKGSLFSSQANDAMTLLNNMPEFKTELEILVKQGYTVNLEYTSPTNRIVISYQEDDLTILSARSHENGDNLFSTKLKEKLTKESYKTLVKKMVSFDDLRNQEIEQVKFVDTIRQEQQGEGYVIEFIREDGSSYLGKVKNLKYISLHHTKDSVNSPKRLFEAIINEASDDLRTMFSDDPFVLKVIEEMENHIQPIYNHIISSVREFHDENNHLSRKDYAIKATQEHSKISGLLMNEYLNGKIKSGEIIPRENKDGKPFEIKENDYKEFSLKNRKSIYKVSDEEPNLDEDGNLIKTHVGLKR